jgi:hypothetical protein
MPSAEIHDPLHARRGDLLPVCIRFSEEDHDPLKKPARQSIQSEAIGT